MANRTPANGQVNCLKYDYEGSHSNSDSHPNTVANQTAGPVFSQFIVNAINSQNGNPVTSVPAVGAWATGILIFSLLMAGSLAIYVTKKHKLV